MKIAVIFCLVCVIAITTAQLPTAAGRGGTSTAMRSLIARQMLSGGGRGMGSLPGLLLMQGAIDPMEYMMCQRNMLYCMLMMQ